MAGPADTRTELIAAVTNDMARLLAAAAKLREIACARPVTVDQVAAAGRMPWPAAPDLQRRGLSVDVRRAYDGAKRADAAYAKFMNSVVTSTTTDQFGQKHLDLGDLETGYDELRELSLRLQESAAQQDCYTRIAGTDPCRCPDRHAALPSVPRG